MNRLRFGLKNLIVLALIFTISLYLEKSGKITAILLGVGCIIAGFRSIGKVADGSTLGCFILGVALILVGAFLEGADNVLRIIGAIGGGLLSFIQYNNIGQSYSPTKFLKRFETLALLAYPAIIIAGFILTIFPSKADISKTLIIIGCVIGLIYTLYALIFMGYTPGGKSNFVNDNGNGVTSSGDVARLAEKIANFFSGSTDYLTSGIDLKYQITVIVVGNEINYCINGTVKGNLNDSMQVSSAQSNLQNKVSRMQQNILSKTQEELSKCYLDRDYNITVDVGDINIA